MSNPFQTGAFDPNHADADAWELNATPQPEEDEDAAEVEEEGEAELRAARAAPSAASSSAVGRASIPDDSLSSPARRPARRTPRVSSPVCVLPPADLNGAAEARLRAALGRTSKLPAKIIAERELQKGAA